MNISNSRLYIKNFVFGVEDSLVSTVGLLSGIASTSTSKKYIVIAGMVLILVEALSMGVGSFLSEDVIRSEQKSVLYNKHTALGGLIMFLSYLLVGFIPLFPYIIFDINKAYCYSIILSLMSLFVLGYFSMKLTKKSKLLGGIKMLVYGGSVVIIATFVGLYLDTLV